MIDRNHPLPLTKQAEVIGISRSSVYYLPKPVSEADLALMRRIDELHLWSIRMPAHACCVICCGRILSLAASISAR